MVWLHTVALSLRQSGEQGYVWMPMKLLQWIRMGRIFLFATSNAMIFRDFYCIFLHHSHAENNKDHCKGLGIGTNFYCAYLIANQLLRKPQWTLSFTTHKRALSLVIRKLSLLLWFKCSDHLIPHTKPACNSCQRQQFPFLFWTYPAREARPLGYSWAKCPPQLSVKPLPGLLVALLTIIKERLYQGLGTPLLIEVPCLLPRCYCAKPHVTLIYLVFPARWWCVETYAQEEKRMIHKEFVACNPFSLLPQHNIYRVLHPPHQTQSSGPELDVSVAVLCS